MSTNQLPITVNGTTLPAVAAAGLRYLIATAGTYAVAKGWVDANNIEGIATILITAATVLYGLYRTRSKQAELITTAEAAPDRVAKVQ
jgi:hypothetical protein